MTSPSALDPSRDTAIIRMENITRRFPGVVANNNVRLRVQPGTFHALIGENGAGKSTLLNILYGRYRPDAGRIFLRGEEVTEILHSPADAIRRGVGMVSQHYALIPALSVLENVMLGAEPSLPGGALNLRQAEARLNELAQRLGIGGIEPHARAERLSIAAQQKVEILKALFQGAQILLLDEPTATLAPQEADALFVLLHTLVQEGATVLFVTHKLREVMMHSQAVTVLRAGRNVGDFLTRETTEQDLLLRMIGTRSHAPFNPRAPLTGEQAAEPLTLPPDLPSPLHPPRPASGSPLLQVEGVTARNARGAAAVRDANLEIGMGEIVGVAGVDGSGQRELAEVIVGLRRAEVGKIFLAGIDLTKRSVRQRQHAGVAYIPEDRHREGLILDFTVAENYLLGHAREPGWGGGVRLHPQSIFARAVNMIQRYDVRIGHDGAESPARVLSGGNQQKVVFARAMEGGLRLLVACQPTRGLDVNATRFVYSKLKLARDRGIGVLLFSLDLDEIFQMSDRIAVMFNGQIVAILPRRRATPELIGSLMTGAIDAASLPELTSDADSNEEEDAPPAAMYIDVEALMPRKSAPEASNLPRPATNPSPLTADGEAAP